MIPSCNVPAALYAIQRVLIKGRCLAAEGADQRTLFKLLDWVEILPSLITFRDEDTTEEFRDMLAGLGDDFPDCSGFLSDFDKGITWQKDSHANRAANANQLECT
jgi:hypothetical protein